MQTERFHCHPSIILERAGGFLTAWLLILLSQADEFLPMLLTGSFDPKLLETTVLFLLFMVLLPGLIAGWQFLVWKKTWICLDENTLIIERNTLNRKKDTYSIPHIANINTEQNLFELLIHTCRVKIDLENATDADSTDISIVLSLKKAQELKKLLLTLRQGDSERRASLENTFADECPKIHKTASVSEILVHCIASLSSGFLLVVLLFLGCLGFLVFGAELTLAELVSKNGNTDFTMQVLAVGLLVISYGYQIIKRLLMFYHFTAFRQENDLIIRYGFFRKQDYTIPIKNIQAIRIVQAPIARLFHFYEARVVCVGIGDSQEELTQLTLCCKRNTLYQQLRQLVPEFSTDTPEAVHKPPRRAFFAYLASYLCWSLLFCLIPWAGISCFAKDFGSFHVPEMLYGIVLLFLSVFYLLRCFCQGYYLGNTLALFSGGGFTKTVTLIPYQNIQHIQFSQNPVSHWLHLFRGQVSILASVLNRDVAVPYMERRDIRALQTKLMEW